MSSYRAAPFTFFLLALLTLAGTGAPEAVARPDSRLQLAQSTEVAQPRARISASRAAAIVQKQYGGKVMNVRTRDRGDRVIYRVKLLVEGRMRSVSVDGNSGKILD